ncbi:serine/arginine repetitive matrix protein 4 [Chanos chanos]|uniref:Serine/arginine repetitive matrix protein 4 n=1 Tax=Chanos chanos TaxID=29144 RepID=A0A6J2WTL0_CHACN|nr:serine/arginine repetitive matrix protein 4 [Chanos chanos]
MASLQQGEKQLFEKFWKGTFKAVATPRPESIIVASITARRTVNKLETSLCLAPKDKESKLETEDTVANNPTNRKGHVKERRRKRHGRHRSRSTCLNADHSPRPASKGKKKKKKSDRKRRRERSRHRSRRRQRYRRSEVEVSVWRSSSTESRSEEHSGHPARLGEDVHLSVNQRGFEWGSDVPKLANKIPPNCSANPPRNSIGPSQPGHGILSKQTAVLANQNKGQPDYDSGNDTSSPPSSKTDGSRLNVNGDNKSTSLEKLRFMDGDSTSDSGNSVTSYVSLSKPETSESDLSASIFRKNSDRTPVRGATVVGNSRLGVTATDRSLSPPPYSRHRRRSSSSRCRSFSSRSSRSSYHHSRSSSFSSGKRARERKRGSSSGMKGSKRSRKQSRRRPYSPIRKRRRDSPSHLEARRITSARKRPIPYYRPSPSSSSRSSSLSSWYSLFSRSRSRSRSRSCSRSRCRSYSSYRTYSRSSSWNSIFGSHSQSRSRSRSRSYDSLTSYSRGRR